MSIFSVVSEVETSDSFHLSRLLLLLNAFAGPQRDQAIEGITKLAKLDFFLRYPSYLEKGLSARHANPDAAGVREFERDSVESRMVRFKYGPWDFRYRRFLNILVGKGLAHVYLRGRTVHVGITESGRAVANRLAEHAEFADLKHRSKLLKTHFDLSASTLVKFVYDTFPEIGTMRLGSPIQQ
jgi:hypothetical protein